MKMIRMVVSFLLVMALLSGSLIAFADTDNTQEAVRISLDEWIGWKSLLDANGGLTTAVGSIYDGLGIQVEFVIINDPTTSSTELINGGLAAAGYTINRYAFLQDRFDQAGVDVTMPFITNYSNGGDGIIATAGIRSVKDLVGKKVAVPRFSEAQTLVEWLLRNSNLTAQEQEGIRANMVYFETAEDAGKAFFSGSVDAAATWEPYLTQARTSTDAAVLFDTGMSTNLILDGLVFRQDFLDIHGDFMTKLIEGALEAAQVYATEFSYIKAFPMFEFETDEGIIEMAAGADLTTWAGNKALLSGMAADVYREMAEIWQGLGETAYPDRAESAFTDTYVQELSDTYENQESAQVDSVFTEGNRQIALEADNTDALLGYQIDIKFDLNSINIRTESHEALDEFVRIAGILDGAFVQIEGNASTRYPGVTDAEITAFSQERADAVAKYFADRGIDTERIITVGNGDGNPIADIATEEGRAANRRTDIYFKVIVGY